MNSKVNLLYCFDKNYDIQALTSINSFLNNYDGIVNIYILHNDPNSFSNFFSEKIPQSKFNNIEIYKFENKSNFKFPKKFGNEHVSKATYFRLFIEDYLPKDLNNILYLDPDVISINKFGNKIEEIFKKLNDGNFLVAGVNYTKSANIDNLNLFKSLNMESRNYFNAGVLFINYKKWIDEDHGNKIRLYMDNFDLNNINNDDQDILNSYVDGDFLELDRWFNYPLIEEHFENDKKEIFNKAFLVHYLGSKKPWMLNGIFNKSSSIYQDTFLQLNISKVHINLKNESLKKIFNFLLNKNYFKTNLIMSLRIIYMYFKKLIL